MKQARNHVRDAQDFNKIETQAAIKFHFLQGNAPKEIHAILTETVACFLPGQAKDLSALLIFINLYMFRATVCPSGMQERMFLHTRRTSTQNNKYKVSHNHSCFSWWWAHSRPKPVEIDKYSKNKLCTELTLFTRRKWMYGFLTRWTWISFRMKNALG